jgi:putative ABC transport system permease protein
VLDAGDREGGSPAVLVDDAAARLLWPGRDPVGHSLVLGTTFGIDTTHAGGRVVGVVANVRDEGLDSEPRPHVYLSHAQFPLGYMTVVARTGGDPMRLVGPARHELKALDPAVPLARPRSMRQWMATTDAERRFDLLLLGVFAVSALLLAAVGVYGVLSHTVRQRSREIGIRVALGANGGQVRAMVLRRALGLALFGVAGGLILSFATARLLGHLLFGVRPSDPTTFLATAAILAAVAMLASWVPARRATRADPLEALRAE